MGSMQILLSNETQWSDDNDMYEWNNLLIGGQLINVG